LYLILTDKKKAAVKSLQEIASSQPVRKSDLLAAMNGAFFFCLNCKNLERLLNKSYR